MLVVTWVSRVGSTKEPSSLRPPRTNLAPWDTASEMCSATCRTTPTQLSDLKKLLKEVCCPLKCHTHLFSSTAVDERTLGGGGLRAVAQPELRPHRHAQLIHKDVVDATLNQEAVGADTRLGRKRTVQKGKRMEKGGKKKEEKTEERSGRKEVLKVKRREKKRRLVQEEEGGEGKMEMRGRIAEKEMKGIRG